MAELYFKDYVARKGAAERYEIASAGTSGDESGNPVHPGTRKKLAQIGIGSEGKRARKLTAADGDYYDLIVVMDERNVRDALRLIGAENAGKVRRLMDFTEEKRDVADPWYTGDFDATFRDVEKGCAALFEYLEKLK